MFILVLLSFIPAILTFFFSLLEKTKFNKLPYYGKQIIIGVSFGILSIFFTIVGSPVDDTLLNVRDSAPIVAGLLFGSPAGIIAGIIGGLYRFFCIYWGGGTFTRLACSIATVMSGLMAAGARRFMFYNKRPNTFFAMGIAAGCEVLHMMLILLTNLNNMVDAINFVMICSLPMILCNALAVGLSVVFFARKKLKLSFSRPPILLTSFSIAILIGMIILMIITTLLTYRINLNISKNQASDLLELNINDIKESLNDNSNELNSINIKRVGESGGYIICSNNLTVLRAYINGDKLNITSMMIDNIDSEVMYEYKIDDIDSYVMYTNYDQYYIFTFMSKSEATLSCKVLIYLMVYVEILIYLTIFCLFYQVFRRRVTKELHKINNNLNIITEGDLDTVIDVRSCKEFSDLSNDINKTVDSLKHHIHEVEIRNENELELARKIQKSAVPFIFPAFPKRNDFDIYASMHTAKEVGEDFYDFYFISDVEFAFIIADVSGKGIPAAMFMMASKTLIKGLAERGKEVNEIFDEANKSLCEGNDADMFLTSWMGIINLETGVLKYVNAGHNPPLIYKNNGSFEYIKEKPNFILAGMDITKYKMHQITLNPGDMIYLYTDGVTEAININNELYGERRLQTILNKSNTLDSKSICENVENDLLTFSKDVSQSDDITMLAFKINYLKTSTSIIVNPNISNVDVVLEFIENNLEKISVSKSLTSKVLITIDEIYSNFKKYANASKVEICFGLDEDKLRLIFKNNGEMFNFTKNDDPDITSKLEDRNIGGLGIYMVKKLASSCEYKYINNENVITVIFDLIKGE